MRITKIKSESICNIFTISLKAKQVDFRFLSAIALDTLSLILELLAFFEVLGITMTSTGVAGG